MMYQMEPGCCITGQIFLGIQLQGKQGSKKKTGETCSKVARVCQREATLINHEVRWSSLQVNPNLPVMIQNPSQTLISTPRRRPRGGWGGGRAAGGGAVQGAGHSDAGQDAWPPQSVLRSGVRKRGPFPLQFIMWGPTCPPLRPS